jgi:hypothetical protein
MKIIILSLLGIGIFTGCHKGDNEAPTITISSPTDNQSFSAGQTVHVQAVIKDNVEIHHVHMYVTNNNNGSQVVHFEDHVDGGTYNLDQSFTTQAGITYKIEIQADDHAGNTGDAQVVVRSE